MQTSDFNHHWATVLLEALTRHGIESIAIAPGSRSTPLTLAAARNSRFHCYTHFDERGLGHFALGLAKASAKPVALIVTSGTAAANLYPAIIEAGLTGEKLVILTADRPPELIDCGANQAIRQIGLYANHPSACLNLPRPTPEIPAQWLVSAIDGALGALEYGALHVNCPFAEPLYGGDGSHYAEWPQALGEWWHSLEPWLKLSMAAEPSSEPDWERWQAEPGVVIAGRVSEREGPLIAQWARHLGWPLISDVLSQTGTPLPCADLWLCQPEVDALLNRAKIIVQFGSSLTSKRLLQWHAACAPEQFWLVDPLPGRLDPAHHRGRRLRSSPAAWIARHPARTHPPWASELTRIAARAQALVAEQLAPEFGEASVAHRLGALLPEHGQLLIGNSLIVRLVDALAQLPAGYPVYGNRGASGIDGLISTMAGVQCATSRPTLALLGDLSTLYDLNGLALLHQSRTPTTLLVINNHGGQIFSMLPTDAAVRERFYCMPQDVDFAHAAAAFKLQYACPSNHAELSEALARSWTHIGGTLIELRTPGAAGAQVFQRMRKHIVAS